MFVSLTLRKRLTVFGGWNVCEISKIWLILESSKITIFNVLSASVLCKNWT